MKYSKQLHELVRLASQIYPSEESMDLKQKFVVALLDEIDRLNRILEDNRFLIDQLLEEQERKENESKNNQTPA